MESVLFENDLSKVPVFPGTIQNQCPKLRRVEEWRAALAWKMPGIRTNNGKSKSFANFYAGKMYI